MKCLAWLELDVKKYKPDEVDMKVENGKVIVSGKQRKETEHGYETSEFHRAYNIPENVDPQSVKSRIENGVLQIEGVKQQSKEGEDGKKLSLEINLGSYKPGEVKVKLQGNGLLVSAENKTARWYIHVSTF
jgi:HSP20 family molecular chaperone IbpA